MKKAIFVLFLFGIQLLNAQVQSGKVVYRVKVIEDQKVDGKEIKDPEIRNRALNKLYEFDHIVGFLAYDLNFSTKKAVFNREMTLSPDNGTDLEEASSSVGIIGDYYTDLTNNLRIHHHYFLGKSWLLEEKIDDIEWEIHDETKEINGYQCQKATAIINLNDIKKGEITAWFAPEIPFQYGPMGFAGLPGLILGLEIRHYYLYANTVKLSKERKTIELPARGERVDWETYNRETDKLIPWKR